VPTLQHRLVIPGVGSSFAPGDVDPLPDTDFYITSRRRVHHPWIAQRGDGPEAGPDISVGGQRLELPLGRSVDGEVQIRIIDVPAPVLVCGASVVVPEGDANLNLGASAFSAGPNMWHRHETDISGTYIDGSPPVAGPIALQTIGSNPGFAGSILFGSNVYDGYMWRVFNGTEGGGAGFVAGRRYAFRCRVNWPLDSGPGNLYIETIGGADPFAATPGATTNRTSFPGSGSDFWTIDPSLNTAVFNGYISAIADGSGEIEFRFGAEGYSGSCNVSAIITDMEIVECSEVESGDLTALYTTGWLADSDARQQLLGRKAYLEESEDGGVTWTRVLYAGYVKQITMDQSLTYLFTLGDAGRGRRVSRAWRDRDPVEDFTP
jgi:hypothetical protein